MTTTAPSRMDARESRDRELAAKLLGMFDLELGDLCYFEQDARGSIRGFVGEVVFAWVRRDGTVMVTYHGRSGHAASSGAAVLLAGDRANDSMSRFVRTLDDDDRQLMVRGRHYAPENMPLNWRRGAVS
jgi:hypothetical protein